MTSLPDTPPEVELREDGSPMVRFEDLTRRLLGVSREDIREKEKEFKIEQRKNAGKAASTQHINRKGNRMATVEERLNLLMNRIHTLENHVEAVWMLVRELYILTSPDTKITRQIIEKFIWDLKNELPDNASKVPQYHQDRALMDVAPHYEELALEIATYLDNVKS